MSRRVKGQQRFPPSRQRIAFGEWIPFDRIPGIFFGPWILVEGCA